MSKKNEVVNATAQEVVATHPAVSEWGDSEVSARDVIIPKILLMQGLSELVSDGKAKIGDYVDSISGEILGSIEKPLKIIPFHMNKVWIVSSRKVGESKFEFERYEEVTAANQGYPLTEVMGDQEIKYEYALQFYVLRPEDTSMPYVLTFKSTSSRAGRILSTQMYVRNKAAGLVPPAYIMELGGKKDKNDKGTFAVMEVKPLEKTSDDLISECLNWYKVIKSGNTKVAAEESTRPQENNYADTNAQF